MTFFPNEPGPCGSRTAFSCSPTAVAPSPFGRRARASRCCCADSIRIGDYTAHTLGIAAASLSPSLGTEHFRPRDGLGAPTNPTCSTTLPPFLVIFTSRSSLASPQTLLPMPRGSPALTASICQDNSIRGASPVESLVLDHILPESHLMEE